MHELTLRNIKIISEGIIEMFFVLLYDVRAPFVQSMLFQQKRTDYKKNSRLKLDGKT